MRETTQRRVRFLIEEFDRLVEPLGYDTDAAKAEFLDVPRSVLSKLRRDLQAPSVGFIAAVKTALPNVAVERLFDFGEPVGARAGE